MSNTISKLSLAAFHSCQSWCFSNFLRDGAEKCYTDKRSFLTSIPSYLFLFLQSLTLSFVHAHLRFLSFVSCFHVSPRIVLDPLHTRFYANSGEEDIVPEERHFWRYRRICFYFYYQFSERHNVSPKQTTHQPRLCPTGYRRIVLRRR